MIDTEHYLEEKSRLVNAVLDHEMPKLSERPKRLHEAMRYSVFSGGKRLRPVLCMAAAESCGGKASDAQRPAAAIELLHAYTLIHDDLPCMDDDDERRGKPTVHVAFGEALAVLTGDALQALAFDILVRAPECSAAASIRQVAELARAAGSLGVIGGQVEDLEASHTTPTPQTMHFIHLHKTADLFRAAIRMGAIAAEASAPALSALTCYAEHLGLAFQMSDDLLDEHQKAPDVKQEASCLQVMDREAAATQTRDLVNKAIAALAPFEPERVAPLAGIARLVENRITPRHL